MQVAKEISYMEQNPASRAVTGTFYQTTQPVSIASAQIASGAVASGAYASRIFQWFDSFRRMCFGMRGRWRHCDARRESGCQEYGDRHDRDYFHASLEGN